MTDGETATTTETDLEIVAAADEPDAEPAAEAETAQRPDWLIGLCDGELADEQSRLEGYMPDNVRAAMEWLLALAADTDAEIDADVLSDPSSDYSLLARLGSVDCTEYGAASYEGHSGPQLEPLTQAELAAAPSNRNQQKR